MKLIIEPTEYTEYTEYTKYTEKGYGIIKIKFSVSFCVFCGLLFIRRKR